MPPLIAGNCKMHGTSPQPLRERDLRRTYRGCERANDVRAGASFMMSAARIRALQMLP
jgi:hypothetical protein